MPDLLGVTNPVPGRDNANVNRNIPLTQANAQNNPNIQNVVDTSRVTHADGRTERGQCLRKTICEEMGFDSLGYQSLDGILEAIGLDRDKVCTYCWTGKE